MTASAQTAAPTLSAMPKADAPAAMNRAKSAPEVTTNTTTGAAVEAETRMANTVMATQRQLSDMTLAFANEVMGFASRRMQAQAEFMAQLSRCHDAADLLDTQLRFVADTTNDYASEMTTLAKVIQPQG